MVTAMAAVLTGSMMTPAQAAPTPAELTKKIDAASDKLEDYTEHYNKLRLDLKKTIDDEKKLAASLAPAQAALKAASAQVGTIAVTSYKQGRVGPATAILSGGTESDMMARMSYLDQIARANQRDIDAYTEATQNFKTRQAALKATQAKQTKQVQTVATQRKAIEKDLKELYRMRTAAYGQAEEQGEAYTGKIPNISGKAGAAVSFAYGTIGKPYLFGADGPGSYDCSGLTSKAWAAAGKSLPHNAAAQYRATDRISRSQLQPGDLVFYRNLAHVGIYVGDGQIIDASRAGQPVKKRSIDIMKPYGFGRV